MAYNEPDQFKIPEVSEIKFIHQKHTKLYVWKQDTTMYVVFRGTDDLGDVKDDINVRTSILNDSLTEVRVHRGFYHQFEAIVPDLQTELSQECDKIVFCGHSLGAALAVIGAFHFSFLLPEVTIQCFTFGSPRVGNSAFVQMFQERVSNHWRVYNFDDPVPMLPLTGNYEHIDQQTLCFGDGTYDQYNRDYYWLWRPIMSISCTDIYHPITPHHIDKYISNLENIGNKSN